MALSESSLKLSKAYDQIVSIKTNVAISISNSENGSTISNDIWLFIVKVILDNSQPDQKGYFLVPNKTKKRALSIRKDDPQSVQLIFSKTVKMNAHEN